MGQIADLFARLYIKPDKASFAQADKLLGFVKSGLVALAGYRAFEFVKGMVEQTVELGAHLKNLSQAAGVPVQTLQELGFAAVANGSSLDEMGGAIEKLSKNMYAASKGGKAQAAAFAAMGIKITDSAGKLRPAEDVLADISDHFHDMPDGAAKTAQAIQTLGRSGAGVIPTLNKGSKGLKEYAEQAENAGNVISGENVDALKEFDDSVKSTGASLTGLKNEAVIALLPTLREMLGDFQEWFKANRKIIGQKLQTIFKALAFAVRAVAAGVGILVDVLTWMGDHMTFVLTAVGALTLALFLLKAGAIESGLAAAAAWIVAALPLIVITAIILALILIVNDLYEAFTGGKSVIKDLAIAFIKWFGSTGVGKVLLDVLHAIEAIITKVQEAIAWLGKMGKKIGGAAYDATHNSAHDQMLNHGEAASDAAEQRASVDSEIATSAGFKNYAEYLKAHPEAATSEHDKKLLTANGGANDVAQLPTSTDDPMFTPGLTAADYAPDAAAGAGPLQAQISAPVNITIPGAGDPKAVATAVKDAVQTHLDNQARDLPGAMGASATAKGR